MKHLAKVFKWSDFEFLGENTKRIISFSASMDKTTKFIDSKTNKESEKIFTRKNKPFNLW